MRRAFYVLLLIALLAIPASSAFAEPEIVQQIPDGVWLLGELWWTPVEMSFPAPGGTFPVGWMPGERVDAWMWRPPTVDIAGNPVWPLTQAPISGSWWMPTLSSEQRRMSYAEDWLIANDFGGYYAEFLLPRDEVWFPCGFPLKWQCNYIVPVAGGVVLEWHSPAIMAYECAFIDPFTLACLNWPWAVEPMDTISPVVIDVFNSESPFPYGYEFELEIAGMFWKFSDID